MQRSALKVFLGVLAVSVAGVASMPVSATDFWQLSQGCRFVEAPVPSCTSLLPSEPGARFVPESQPSIAPLFESPDVAELKRELQRVRDVSKQQEDILRQRVAELERDIELKNSRLTAAVRAIHATRQELVAVRGQLENWSTRLTELRETARSAEIDNRVLMQSLIQLLEQFLQAE